MPLAWSEAPLSKTASPSVSNVGSSAWLRAPSPPSAFNRHSTASSGCAPSGARPAIRILPSGWSAIALTSSFWPSLLIPATPSVSNVGSSASLTMPVVPPLGFRRHTTARSGGTVGLSIPPTTILPLDCSATAVPISRPPVSCSANPSLSNVGSSAPLGWLPTSPSAFRRQTAMSSTPGNSTVPTTTILPSGATATACALITVAPAGGTMTAWPSESKLGSGAPPGSSRETVIWLLAVETSTNLPPGAVAAGVGKVDVVRLSTVVPPVPNSGSSAPAPLRANAVATPAASTTASAATATARLSIDALSLTDRVACNHRGS